MGRPFRLETRFEVPGNIAELWPHLVDNDRMKRMDGAPPSDVTVQSESSPYPVVRESMRGPIRIVFDELPWEWERHLWLGQRKVGLRGLSGPGRVQITFRPAGEGRTEVTVTNELAVGSFGGRMLMRIVARSIARSIRRVAAAVVAKAPDPFQPPSGRRRGDVEERARVAIERWRDKHPFTEEERDIAAKLLHHLGSWDDGPLLRMRPMALARQWGTEPDRTLLVFLKATRAGVLDMAWDIVCPDCRRPPRRLGHLSEVTRRTHCALCAIDFDVELDRYVEVTFRPASAVRSLSDVIYCFANPGRSPHVASQLLFPPSTARTFDLRLEPGAYRLHVKRTPFYLDVRASPDGAPEQAITVDPSQARGTPVTVRAGEAKLTVTVAGDLERLVLVERTEWLDDAATATHVTTLPGFRDLFPDEALGHGEQIVVRHLAFLFTDLKGSTSMYDRVGDGPAYSTVREHFALLQACIERERGSVVKTIGDAVMAVFDSTEQALAAAISIQKKVPSFNASRPHAEPIVVKLGVHAGPCIAVNANGALDYFGTTVNIAARAQAQSTGDDLVVLSEIGAGAERLLGGLARAPFQATLSGFTQPFALTRYLFRQPEAPDVAIAAAAVSAAAARSAARP